MMLTMVQNILTALGGLTAVILLVAATFWKLIEKVLTTWLTKRVGRSLERDAERYKHELSRDMETYKNELARSQGVDKLRAEMRKTVAENLFEKRLTAYHGLYVAIGEIPAFVLSRAMQPVEHRVPLEQIIERVQELDNSLVPHQIFMPLEFKQQFRELLSTLLITLDTQNWDTNPALTHGDERVIGINRLVAALCFKLDQYYKSLPDDLANAIVQQ